MAAGISGGLGQTCCFTCDSSLNVPGMGGCQHSHQPSGCQGHFRSLDKYLGTSSVVLPFGEESGWTQQGHLFLTAITTSCSRVLPRVSSKKIL